MMRIAITGEQRATIEREYGDATVEVLDAPERFPSDWINVFALIPSPIKTGMTIAADGSVLDRWEIEA